MTPVPIAQPAINRQGTQRTHRNTLLLGLLLALSSPPSLIACSVCYGQSDSPLAQGLNWGILSLLVVVVSVLGGFAAFFIYLANRASVTPPTTATEPLLASAKEI